MSFHFVADGSTPVGRLTFARTSGLAEVERALIELLESPSFDPAKPLLIDLTNVIDGSVLRLKDFAERMARLPRRPSGGLAIVAVGVVSRIGGLALAMYLSHEGIASQVFEDENQASAWLTGRPAPNGPSGLAQPRARETALYE